MFFLAEMKDVLPIEPENLLKPRREALRMQIEKKYVNCVVRNVGLCVALYEIKDMGCSYILPGDPRSMTEIEFTIVVFEPFPEEVLIGWVYESDEVTGVHIRLGDFYADIIIPPEHLRTPSEFNSTEELWCWKYQEQDLPIETGAKVAFQIVRIEYREMAEKKGSSEPKLPAMVIIGSFASDGLGPLNWWQG